MNLHRRHLTPGQQAVIVAAAQDWERAQKPGGDRKTDQGATLHLDSANDRATQSGASLRTQKAADKLARASPELALKVAHGEISLPRRLSNLSLSQNRKPPSAYRHPLDGASCPRPSEAIDLRLVRA